jgi:serine/threonine protein kinase
VIEWKQAGRAADMFSLGCILLEILSLHRRGSLNILKVHRDANPTYHANVKHLPTWLKIDQNEFSRREHHLECEISLMLSADPKRRPKAIELLHSIAAYDLCEKEALPRSIFGECCKRELLTRLQLKKMMADAAKTTHFTEELMKEKAEAKMAQAFYEEEMVHLKVRLERLHTDELYQKEKQLQAARAETESVSAELVTKSQILLQTEKTLNKWRDNAAHYKSEYSRVWDRLASSQARCWTLMDEIEFLQKRAALPQQFDAPVVSQSGQDARSRVSLAKPKMSLLEAMYEGLTAGLPKAKEAAKIGYEEGRNDSRV